MGASPVPLVLPLDAMPALKDLLNGAIALFLLGFIGLNLFRLSMVLGHQLHWF